MRKLAVICIGSFAALLAACASHGAGAGIVPTAVNAPQSFQRAVADDAAIAPNAAATPSGVTVYTLGDGGANAQAVEDIDVGADGNFYFATVPEPSSAPPFPVTGEIGAFNPSTHMQTFQQVPYGSFFIHETRTGVWVEEYNNADGTAAIDRYTAIGGSDTRIPVPIGPFFTAAPPSDGLGGGIATDSSGNIWFGSQWTGQIGYIHPATNAATLYSLGSVDDEPQFMVYGSDKHLWVTDDTNDGVWRVTTSGATIGSAAFYALPQGPVGSMPELPIVEGITEGQGGKLYTGSVGYVVNPAGTAYFEGGGYLNGGLAAAPPNFSSLIASATLTAPYILTSYKTAVYFNDVLWDGLGIYDTTTGAVTVLPLSTGAFGGMVVDSAGNPWLGCTTATRTACIEQVVLAKKWQIYPSTAISLYTTNANGVTRAPGLIGIGETGDSGPFTVSSSNTAICKASIYAGLTHNITVTPVKAGKCMVTVTDAHARTVKVNVTVIKGSGFAQLRGRLIKPPYER